jgi:hypothetical protein
MRIRSDKEEPGLKSIKKFCSILKELKHGEIGLDFLANKVPMTRSRITKTIAAMRAINQSRDRNLDLVGGGIELMRVR